MSFLLRRTKKALAGWYDNFNRPNEPAVQPPWASWGDAAAFQILDNKLKLAAEGAPSRGGNYDGGVAYEHQPLTENWAVEFTRAPIGSTSTSNSNETEQNIFLDRNWTEGGNASSSLYQVIIQLKAKYNKEEKDKETGEVTKRESMDRHVNLLTRDKTTTTTVGWIFTSYANVGTDYQFVPATDWAGALRLRVFVFFDRWLLVWINDSLSLLLDLYDPRFRFGPRRRSANFAQVSGLVASIDNFRTYDLDVVPPRLKDSQWSEVMADDFERTASTTVGNGWTQTAGNNFGIHNGALSMNSPIAGSDGFRQVRRNIGSPNMRYAFSIGQGTGSPNSTAPTAILGRMTADGRSGLAAVITQKLIRIAPFTWGGTLAAPSWDLGTVVTLFMPDLDKTIAYAFVIDGDYAWIKDHTNDRVLQIRDGINTMIAPTPDRTWAGSFHSRYSFINSAPLSSVRIFT
ncbi:hypothetical protein CH300_20235 [Rhodococcus sp. 15-1154-1]|nr:hypothetical protein [Rhodococcus sp. 15-1154-1]OZF00867.1 hypothetical protein CH300_20235 [Rhodococcus sp. 15-1154-1]